MDDDTTSQKSLRDYLSFVRRRKWSLLLPAGLVAGASLAYALLAPATYESEATILVEDQAVSTNYVRSAITGFASQQVQVISERVLTVENVARIANKYELYRGDKGRPRVPSAELERTFRRNMTLDLVSAETIDPRNYRPTEITIAFKLGFRADSADTAKNVTDELVTLFLNENERDRSSVASSTSEFLSGEVDVLNAELMDLEQQLADFKLANEGSLPEQRDFNMSTLERTQRALAEVGLRSQELKKQQIELRAQLAQIEPTVPRRAANGEPVMSDVERLRALQAERRRKSAVYRDNHPDIERLNREIAELEGSLDVGIDASNLVDQLQEQRSKLAQLSARYNPTYFEVVKTQRVVEQLERKLAEVRLNGPQSNRLVDVPNNPAYVLITTQLSTADTELESLRDERIALEAKVAEYEEYLRRAPNVERDYNALLRNYDNANEKFQDIKSKAREARVASNLEANQKGERFIVVEPAVTPVNPISPNRKAIMLIGLVLAAGAGFGTAIARDVIQGAIHGAQDVYHLVGAQPLAVIPYIRNEQEIRSQRKLTVLMFTGLLLAALSVASLYAYKVLLG